MKGLTLLFTIGIFIFAACRQSIQPAGPMALSPVPQDVAVTSTPPPTPTPLPPTFTFTPSVTASYTPPPFTPTLLGTSTPRPTSTLTYTPTFLPVTSTPIKTFTPRPTRIPASSTLSPAAPFADTQTHASQAFGIAFDFPSNWHLQTDLDNLMVLVSYGTDGIKQEDMLTLPAGESRISFALMQGLFNGPSTLDEYMEQARAGALLVEEKDWGTMGGLAIKRLVFDVNPSADAIQLSYMYMLETDEHLIQISFDGDALDVFDLVATSIRLHYP